MIERLPRGKRNLVLGGLAVLLLWFCWTIRSVLNPLLVGYLLAYILHPLVDRLERRGQTRRRAVNLIFLGGLIGSVTLMVVLAFQFRNLARDLILDDGIQAKVQARLNEINAWLPEGYQLTGLTFEELRIKLRELLGTADLFQSRGTVLSIGEASLQAASSAASYLVGLAGSVVSVLLVPLYAYYMLFLLGTVHEFVGRYLPKRDREQLVRVAGQIGEVIANFFRGRLGACLLKGLFLSFGLALLGVDYAFLFGLTSGFLSLVPFAGPLLGFVFAFAAALVEHGVLGGLWRVGIVFGLGELLEGYVIIPKVLGDTLGLHPVVVLFAMLAGGAAFGTLGILLALPVTASAVILFKEFVLPSLQQFADEDDPPPEPGPA